MKNWLKTHNIPMILLSIGMAVILWMYIVGVENPEKDKVETPGKQTPGKLPKTGDYGMDKNVLLLAALIFGSGYLACEYYEKKKA